MTVKLTHPPSLGINVKRVAFGANAGDCSAEIMDRLSRALSGSNVEILDRRTARQTGSGPGSAVLVVVNIGRCDSERRRDYTDSTNLDGSSVRTFNAVIVTHIRGSLQAVDMATGRVFSTNPLDQDPEFANHSTEHPPDFPSEDAARDDALGQAASGASRIFLPWNEEKQISFFNDKECNLASAWALLKGGDLNGAARQSEENLATCPAWPKVKESAIAHACYNAGLASLLLHENEKALGYLRQSAKLKGGDLVAEAIALADLSAQLEAEAQQVAERTKTFEQEHESAGGASQPDPSKGPSATVQDRLIKLNELLKQGLISQQEFDAKRAEILKDL